MKRYQCHKIVEASKVTGIMAGIESSDLYCEDGCVYLMPNTRFDFRAAMGGYVVRYEDGYLSWSPAKAFEEGYTELSAFESLDLTPKPEEA